MKKAAFGLLLLTSPGLALAESLSYDYVDFGYVQVKPDEGDATTDGFGIALSRATSQNLFFAGGLSYSKADDVHIPDVTGTDDFNGTVTGMTLSLGFGGHTALTDATDFVYQGSLLVASVKGDGMSGVIGENDGSAVDDNDVGFGANIKLRSALNQTFEGTLGVGYASVFDANDTSYGVGLVAHVGERSALTFGVDFGDDVKAYSIGFRYNL